MDGRGKADAPPPENSVPASRQTFLYRRQLSLMLYLLFVSASGARTGRRVMGAQGWASPTPSTPLVPHQISQWSDLTSLVQAEDEWVLRRPKGDNESDKEG